MPAQQVHREVIVADEEVSLKLWFTTFTLSATHISSLPTVRRTSKLLINGEIVSGTSGDTGPSSFQLPFNALLTRTARLASLVTPYNTASELPSCGCIDELALSRYIPADSSHKLVLNASLSAAARER